MSVDLHKLSFGAPAAERDENLIDYFIESASFKRLRDGKKTVALGNRGSGKTAIFRILSEQAKQKGQTVMQLAPEDYSYELLSETMVSEVSGSWKKQGAYSAAWKYVLYVLAMKAVTERGLRTKRGSALKIYNYLRDNHANIDIHPIGALVSYLKRLEGIKLGKFEGGLKTRELQKLYRLEEIHHLLDDLKSITVQKPVLLLVDELDRGWDASEDAKAFVAGLFHAALTINTKMPNIRVLLSLRKELYNSIPSLYEDAQKVRDIIEVIEWDEKSLLELISRRISVSLPREKLRSNTELWNTIFTETLDYRQTNSFNYVVDRTLYRPREIIQFCESIRENAISSDISPPLNYDTISDAEIVYSEMRLKDIASEYRFEYPGLEDIFETFRGLPYSFDRDGLEFHCLQIIEEDLSVGEAKSWCSYYDIDDMIRTLWQVGFLRAQTIGGLKARRRSGSSYLGSHQISNLNLININRFYVHQMFRTYLGMKEGTYQP